MTTGFFVGRLVNIHPVESGIVAACRASQGGTGDVAILSASDRMSMMPFAQVATRIGGAITVTLLWHCSQNTAREWGKCFAIHHSWRFTTAH